MTNDPSTASGSSIAGPELSSAGSHSNTTTPTVYSADSPAKAGSTHFGKHEQPGQRFDDDPYHAPHLDASPYSSSADAPHRVHGSYYTSPPRHSPPPSSTIYPSTPSDFAELFPSSRELLVRHDDTTVDGNMNLRVDAEIYSASGRPRTLTLYHLRLYDLRDRDFALRRYHRDSGREVCNTTKKPSSPAAAALTTTQRPTLKRSLSSAFASLRSRAELKSPGHSLLERHDSGYDSAVDEHSEAAPPAGPVNLIRLNFSNYSQVELRRVGRGAKKRYEFEYWGVQYCWRRQRPVQGDAECPTYWLTTGQSTDLSARIQPVVLSEAERQEELEQGGWVTPCSMRIIDQRILRGAADVADVVVATGLMMLVDDTIRRRFHSTTVRHLVIPIPMASPWKVNLDYLSPKKLIDETIGRGISRRQTS